MAATLSAREAVLVRAGEVVLLSAAVFVPMRVVMNQAAGRDLHLTALSIAAVLGLGTIRFALTRSIGRVRWLDGLIVAFLAWCAIHLAFVGEPHPRALKGFLVETRFAWIYLAARALGIGIGFSRRLLTLYLWLAIAIGGFGLVEYFFSWGRLPELLGFTNDPRYLKLRIPRLYSLVITPAGTAYFLYGALCAAAARWTNGERRLAGVAAAVCWMTIPLTLTRTAFAWSVALVLTLGAARRAARTFLLLSIMCCALSLTLFQYVGAAKGVVSYAQGAGGKLSDGSAKVHDLAFAIGFNAVEERPLGFGFGHAGALAFESGGLTMVGETYFLILAAQAGIPAVVLLAAIFALAAWVAFTAARSIDRDRNTAGLFAGSLLAGLVLGSMYLPIGSTAWMQLYLFSVVAALVNTRSEEQGAVSSARPGENPELPEIGDEHLRRF